MDDSIGRWIQRRRRALDLTQEQLAQRVGCAAETIRKIEAGVRRPSASMAARIASALGLSDGERAAFIRVVRLNLPMSELTASIADITPPVSSAAALLPRGTVTFLFTDIVGSTQLWERDARAMQEALLRHNALIQSAVRSQGGTIFKVVGDSICAAFSSAIDALQAALLAQQTLQHERWGTTTPLQVRMAVHTGVVDVQDGEYAGPPLNRTARLLTASHGAQVLVSRVTQELAYEQLPNDLELRDLGVFRLKDLSSPEQIFQLVAPDLPRDFPPPLALDMRLTNLPLQLSTMVNRTNEVAELTALLQAGKRLVTLTGPGGVGKTRLALHLVARLLGDFPDGIWFVDLSHVRDTLHLATETAQVLGVVDLPNQDLEKRLLAWLRNKHILVILDNVEQVVDAAGPIERWLQAAPGLSLLAASRIPLRLAGEQEYPIAPLALPDVHALQSFDQIRANDSVKLFITRAQELQPHFELSTTNAADIAEICWQLDGLPLAIEIAAARLRLFPPKQLLSQLRALGRLQILSQSGRNLPDRQQTMQTTLLWSYNLLRPSEQILLARVGVFVSDWTLEAIEGICADESSGTPQIGGEAVMNLLARLVEHNLIQQIPSEAVSSRFTLLKTIREFALEQLQLSGMEPTIRYRHAMFYFSLATRARNYYDSGIIDAFSTVHQELVNLRAALVWAVDNGMVTLAAETVISLGPFWFSRMPVTLEWLEATLAKAHQLPQSLRANVLALTGSLSWEAFRNPRHARELCEASLAIYRSIQDRSGIAMALTGLAHIAVATGEVNQPLLEMYLSESLALRRELGDTSGIAETLSIQGRLAVIQGNFSQADALMTEALTLRRTIGGPLGVAVALFYIGWLAFQSGDYERMGAVSSERMGIERAMGNPQGIADCALWRGVAALWLGDVANAGALVELSLRQIRELNEPRSLPHILDACAHAAATRHDLSMAQAFQTERIRVLQLLGAHRGIAWSQLHLGVLALARSDLQQASECVRAARAILAETGDQFGPTHLFSDLSPRLSIAGDALLIETAAAIALARQLSWQAAQLAGAAAALRAAQRLSFSFPDERDIVTTLVSTLQAQLSAAQFSDAWESGWALPSQQAVTGAMAVLLPSQP